MFYEFGLIEHILIILSIIVFSTRKNLFYFIIIAISLFIQLFITWQLKKKISKDYCIEYNLFFNKIKIC